MGKWGDVACPSVTSFPTHTSGAGGLKFGRNNHHIGGSKFTNQIFDILSRILISKLCSNLAKKKLPPPYFIHVKFHCRKQLPWEG